MRLELPDDGWAVLTPPRKVKERKRRSWIAASEKASDTVGQWEAGIALVVCLVEQWSYGDVTPEVFEELDVDTADRLLAACLPLAEALTPNFDPDPDPKAPTVSSTPSPTDWSKVPPPSVTIGSDGTS